MVGGLRGAEGPEGGRSLVAMTRGRVFFREQRVSHPGLTVGPWVTQLTLKMDRGSCGEGTRGAIDGLGSTWRDGLGWTLT